MIDSLETFLLPDPHLPRRVTGPFVVRHRQTSKSSLLLSHRYTFVSGSVTANHLSRRDGVSSTLTPDGPTLSNGTRRTLRLTFKENYHQLKENYFEETLSTLVIWTFTSTTKTEGPDTFKEVQRLTVSLVIYDWTRHLSTGLLVHVRNLLHTKTLNVCTSLLRTDSQGYSRSWTRFDFLFLYLLI